jgi:peptide/nickel transport system substrate-binding protein
MTDADLKSFDARAKYYSPVSFGSQLNQLTWLGASILDQETMKKAESDGTLKDYGITWAVGTGPYKFESWKQGDSVTLVKNKDYFDKNIKANADKIVFKTIKDPSALKTAFLNKEVDLIMNVVPLDAREIEKQGGKILTTNGYFGYHYLAFNMKSPKVGQVNKDGTPDLDGEYDLSANSAKLRFAILYSINPSDIVNSPDIMDKRGIVTLQYVESLPFGHIDDPKGTRLEEGNKETGYYNPQKAKQLFDSLPASFKQPGSLKCTALSGSVHVKEALVVKDQVKKALGVDLITIEQVALSELATRRRESDPKVWDLLVNWTQTDDSYYIFVAFDGFNTSLLHDTKYYSKDAQEWIAKGNSLPNGPERHVAYQNAQKAILKAMPRVPLVAIMGISASQPNIEGVEISPSGSFKLKNAAKITAKK